MRFDNSKTFTREQWESLGVQDHTQAQSNLDLMRATMGADGLSELLPGMAASLAIAADPDMAINNFERFVNELDDVPSFLSACRAKPGILTSLVTIFGASRFLSSYLINAADEILPLLADDVFLAHRNGKEPLREKLSAWIGSKADDQSFSRILRLFRKQEMLRIGLRDLLGKADLQETVADLSDLAEVCLQKAYEWADAGLSKRHGRPHIEGPGGSNRPSGFAVIAMGKLGGRELNFSSDVDLMYVYAADGETDGIRQADGTVANRITNHQYFIKLAEKLSSAIGEKTEDGFVFRVDLRLRPEGQRGPLAQSLGGYEIYYESWGQTWERSALIKARPVAGDESVGREFMERITPFVYRKYLDFGAIAEIGEMKQKINKDVQQKGKTYRDVKLGYGGIREIEFVIQAIQLIYGGRDRALREKNALKALHTLSQKGLITYQEHAILSRAYVFLRTVEHRIQILDDLQTQTLPADERELRSLARRAGYYGRGKEAELLLRDYSEHTRHVHEIYDELFAFRGDEPATAAPGRDYGELLDEETTEREAVSTLGKIGFQDPEKAYRNLMLLREGPAFVHQTPRSRRLFHEIFPPLFEEIIRSPDPDMAFNHLESFLAAQGSWEIFQSLVKLDASAIKVLIAIFANSEDLSRLLVSRPVFLQNMIETLKTSAVGTKKKYAKELSEALSQKADITEQLDVLRRFKHQEEIRIGMSDLLSGAGMTSISHGLSKLAEVCLDAALRLAAQETGKRYGFDGFITGLAVIGVGKLGGREMTYGSDLDILYVFSEPHAPSPPTGLTLFEYFSKVAEKTIAYLTTMTREGFVFRTDTRLRPTGSKGPLVQSLDAFKSYYSSEAETWELQALLRARFVAGDRTVGADFCSTIQNLMYRDADRTSLARDVRSMRKRMEEEVGKENTAQYNIKQGAGGIVDIEFVVQYLQLLYGKHHRWLRVPGTYDALRAIKKEKLLGADECTVLLEAYEFMRRLESRLRIVSNQSSSELSRNPEELRQLARRMGYPVDESTGRKLLEDYEKLSRQVRSVFEKLLKTD